jgi:V-type H+-transporting ATPase proteolipid subunit
VAIYGVIMAIILQGKINESACGTDATFASCAFAGYALFWTGVSVGFSNLFCG